MSKKTKMKSRIELTKSGHQPLFRKIHHVLKARAGAGDFSQFNLSKILVEENRVVATNGHVLCVAEIPKGVWLPGFYLVVKDTKAKLDLIRLVDDKGFEFPEYLELLHPEYKEEPTEVRLCSDGHRATISVNYANVIRAIHAGFTIEFNYFKMFSTFDKVYVPKSEQKITDHQPLIFCEDGLKAVIMPLFTDNQL